MNNSTLLLLEKQSIANLRATLAINITIFIVLGFITTLSNVGTIFVLVKGGKTFRTNHYKLVIHSACVSAIEAFHPFLVQGVVRIVDTVIGKPETITVLNCALILLPGELCWTLKQCNVLELASDRLIAIMYPVKYRNYNFSNKYILIMIGLCWVVTGIDESVKYGLYTKQFADNILTICTIGNTNPDIYLTFRNSRNIIVGILTLITYVTAMILVKMKISGRQSESTNSLKKKFGYKLMLTNSVDGLIYTCTLFVSQIYAYVIMPLSEPHTRMFLSPIGFIFILLSTTPRFLVYFIMNNDFKLTALKLANGCLCRARKNTVEPYFCNVPSSRNDEMELYTVRDEHKEKYGSTTFQC